MTTTTTKLKPPISQRGSTLAKPRNTTKNTDDPRGRFGEFLRDWLDRKHGGDETILSEALGMSDRAIRKWCEGVAGPAFSDLDAVAQAMGFEDWGALGTAVRKFHAKK